MNYEFHVVDYVETYSGAVGYIISIEDDAFTWVNHTSIRDGNDVCSNVEQRNFYSSVKDIFARIGTYDFTKKEKKKIEPLNYNASVDATIKQLHALKDKINELVDAVNELRDKEDNE